MSPIPPGWPGLRAGRRPVSFSITSTPFFTCSSFTAEEPAGLSEAPRPLSFPLFQAYWLGSLEGSAPPLDAWPEASPLPTLQRWEESFPPEKACSSGNYQQRVLGCFWLNVLGFQESCFSIRCRLHCFLAAGSHCLICTPWLWPPWELGPGNVRPPSTTSHPVCCRARFGHLVYPSSTSSPCLLPFYHLESLGSYVSP